MRSVCVTGSCASSALALCRLGCSSEDVSSTASAVSDPADSVSPAAAGITQAHRDCGGGDNATLVGRVTGVPDGAAVEVIDGDGKPRGTGAVSNGAFEVYLDFPGYSTSQAVPTMSPGGSLIVREAGGSVLTERPFDLADLTGVTICG